MANESSVIVSTLIKNKILKVVINRPKKKNAISLQMYKELTMLLNDTAKNKEVVAFVLTGSGDFFSSGNDIDIASLDSSSIDIQEGNLIFKNFIDALIMYPKLLIAVVNGPAIGVGCTMLGLFDMIYASDKAYFRTPFTSLGLVAEACSSYTFPKILGHSKAGDMLYMGYKMNAFEAKQYGLITEVYSQETLEMVWNYINHIFELSSESILAIKRLVSKWNRNILLQVNEEETQELKKRWESPDLFERLVNTMMRKAKL